MSETTELVVIDPKNKNELFTTPNGLVETLQNVKSNITLVAPDTSTAKGREQIRSLAFRVTKSKTYIEKIGKEISAELKELPKIVDANRKHAMEFLESLATEIRQPLTDWEEEQKRLEAEAQAKKEAEELAAKVEADHELALLMNKEFDRERAEQARIAAEKAEADRLAQIERERVIAEQAAAKAKADAEAAAKAEAERVALEVKQAQEKAERERIEAQVRAEAAEKARVAAELKHKSDLEQAAKDAEARRLKAIADEKARVAAEEKRLADEQAKREADTKHRKAVNGEALSDLISAGLTEEQAKKAITAIAKGLVSHISIKY